MRRSWCVPSEPSGSLLTVRLAGSKTAQLLEALHANSTADPAAGPSIPSGLLVANDNDYKRTHLLVHQSLRRIPSPAMMVTNLDASAFPIFKLPVSTARQSGERSGTSRLAEMPFDRVLCDVPCSGDGTLRKNVNIWRDWTVSNGHGLHTRVHSFFSPRALTRARRLQLKILRRGIRLLRPGGVLVYSTCSLNPVENEAVVSAALGLCSDMTIVDVSDRLPGLERRPGMTNWKVMRKDASAAIEAATDVADDDRQKKFPKTMWPDGKEASRHLERCVRIYPHLQDSGGFFVAVLRKQGADVAQPAQNLQSATQPPPVTNVAPASSPDVNLKRAASPASAQPSEGKRQKPEPLAADEDEHSERAVGFPSVALVAHAL